MAKTQIKNYTFKPGIGALDYAHPDACSLLSSNKTFIQKEASAYITNKIDNATRYTPTAATYTPSTGLLQLTIGSNNFNVGDAVLIAVNSLTFTTYTYPRITDPAYNKAITITSRTNTTITLNVGDIPGISTHTFVSATTNAVSDVFYNYTNTSEAKCERDIGYVVDAYIHDLRYNGNEKIRNTIKYYWEQTVAQVDGNRGAEIAAHNFISRLIQSYIFTNTAYSALNNTVAQTIDLAKSVSNLQFTPTAATYTPTTGTMTLTIGSHSLAVGSEIFIAPESIVFTCLLDSNATTHAYPRPSGVPNDTGKDPYYYAPITITDVTTTTVTFNIGISSDTTIHTFVSADANSVTSGAYAKINTLAFNTVDVIANGLTAMPTALPTGVGTIKIQGKHPSSDILLITNTTKNEIIYNFSNPATGGTFTIKDYGEDEDFVSYLQTTDGVTTIGLNYNTSSHSSTDDIQIFIEEKEVRTRPYDFGTDAIERNRIAEPLSMLDADFEYGLQPTKWSAIGTLRGYPSVYEIPGTDTGVSSITTDASTGTSGIGQSLITVTTVGPHGFSAGDPITIKALANSISGAARAEGSFVINTVPTPSTFTYYAKAKVGTADGQVLSTTYSQLRKAGFYTGAAVGSPTFSILSNGTSGSMSAQLNIATGSTIIPYDGLTPEVGSPLTSANIPLGSQVTGSTSTSQGGGTYITPDITANTLSGNNIVYVQSTVGIVENLAVDRGDGTAIYVTNITPSYLEFSGNFTSNIISNIFTYNDVSGTNVNSSGNGATFDIAIPSTDYFVDAIATAGNSYSAGDRIKILGSALGGVTPDNDLILYVDEVDEFGGVVTASVESGVPFDGEALAPGLTATRSLGNLGIGAKFNVSYLNGVYTNVDIPSPDTSQDYTVGDILVLPGSVINPFNGTSFNDLYILVTGIGSGGGITSVAYAGTAPQYNATVTNPAYTSNTASGTAASFIVNRTGSSYVTSIDNAGIDYLPGEEIYVDGTLLGGTSPTNDLTIIVGTVGITGNITSVTSAGTNYNGTAVTDLGGATERIGTGATFDVSSSGGVYTVTVATPGSGYAPLQELTILGTDIGGLSPANDITVTIDTVNSLSAGLITSISYVGTGIAAAIGPYTGVSGSNVTPVGSGAEFSVIRNFDEYTTVSLGTGGINYKVGDRIRIDGSFLDGTSPTNDLTIIVTGINPIGNVITTYDTVYTSANPGTNFDLISTVLMSEATTGTILKNVTISFSALATIGIAFTTPHGFVPGDSFITTVSSDDGTNGHSLAAGSFFATEIPSLYALTYTARTTGAINIASGPIKGIVYPRPDSFFIHRPFDGGVQLGTGGPQHGAQAIRQSKKYIRYQSGKGIMYTTGALFAPSYDLRSVTSDGIEVNSLITVETDDNDHGVQVGGIIRLLGIVTPGYNSGTERASPPDFDYEVVDVIDERRFKVRSQRRLGSTTAELGFAAQMSVVSWHGATVRSGIFDDQNGIFWEYNGTDISVNQRTGTKQISGTIAMTVDQNSVTGTNTRFRDQVKAGDRIIVKGMTHVVTNVFDNTTMSVSPDWRGVVNISGTKANLVVDKKVKQSEFNLDRLDGTGPSGYNIDIAKMQMIGIQYSWYGAGFIDFMLRGSDGNFVFCHRMRNSNINTEAFMRSGNLPVRYEVTNEGPPGQLAENMTNSQTTIPLVDASFFPESGTVYIDNEIINFEGKSSNTLTNCTRAASLTNFQAGADRIYTAGDAATHERQTGVVLISNTITPLISHWGSAFLTDGGFDSDRGYIFSYSQTAIAITTTKQTAFMIRLAPSVSNAIVGDLGERELLNRAQLLLQGLEITSDGVDGSSALIKGGIVIEGVLNPQNYPVNPGSVGWSGLSGVAQGGQPSFAQIAAGGSIAWSTGASATTATATSIGSVTAVLNSGIYGSGNGSTYIYVNASDYRTTFGSNDLSLVIGRTITGSGIRSNTTIVSGYISPNSGDSYGYFQLNQGTNSNINPNVTDAFTIVYNTALTNRNFAYLTKASFEASAAKVGTGVSAGSSLTIPANTQVNRVSLITWAGTQFYEVQFNNTYTGTLALTTGTITFSFVQPPYAQPGETVFSFIATPGERSTLELAQLKELTNTALGGRGTFPNGPDVLAINVYKVSGAETTANITVRWGEAQA